MTKFNAGDEVWLLPGAVSASQTEYFPANAQVSVPIKVTVQSSVFNEGDISVVSDDLRVFGYVSPECLSYELPEGWTTAPNDADTTEDDPVNHPGYYGGGDWPYEPIKVIEAWHLNFSLGNVIKYIARAEHKGNRQQDLQKALFYLKREVGSD